MQHINMLINAVKQRPVMMLFSSIQYCRLRDARRQVFSINCFKFLFISIGHWRCRGCLKLLNCRQLVVSESTIFFDRYAVMQRYHGALNFREHIRSTITPCGSFVIAGSEDAAAYMWNTETGMAIFPFCFTKCNRKWNNLLGRFILCTL